MKLKLTLLMALAMAGSAAFGDTRPPQPPQPPQPPTPPALPDELKPYDTDGNGILSPEEMKAYLDATRPKPPEVPNPPTLPDALKAYDVDGDGRLSPEEWKAFLEDHKPTRPPNPADADGDGTVTPEEAAAFAAAVKARVEAERLKRFTEADTDADGSLSFDEFKAKLPAGVSAERAQKLFDALDTDASGGISKEEFLANVARPPGIKPPTPPSGGGGRPHRPVKPPTTDPGDTDTGA